MSVRYAELAVIVTHSAINVDDPVNILMKGKTVGMALEMRLHGTHHLLSVGRMGVRFYLFTRSSIGLHKRTGFLRTPIYLRVDGTGSANVVKLVVEGV